jgi:hypothetical protein
MIDYLKMIILLVSCAASAFGTWYITSDHYQKVIAQHQVELDKAVDAERGKNVKELADSAAKFKLAEEQHAKDQLLINQRDAYIDGVRIHIPTSCGAVPSPAKSGANTDGSADVFSRRVDEAFRHLQEGVEQRIVIRCAQLNIDAIQSNTESR